MNTMKKFILSLVAIISATVSMSAMSLKDAFNALSNIPNVTVTAPDYNLPVIADAIQNCQLAAGYNMNQQQIEESGTAALTLLNQVPLTYMINGGANNQVAAFVYTNPVGENSNEILIAAMSGYRGSVVFLYGTVDNATQNAIENAPLKIECNFLSLEAKLPDGSDFNIVLSKAR